MTNNLDKTIRIQLSIHEVRMLRNLMVQDYHCDRRNLYYIKKRVAHGEPENRMYSIAEEEKNLAFTRHLLKKLSKVADIKWSEQ